MEIVIKLRVVAVVGRVGKELIVVPKNKNKYQFKNQFNNQFKNLFLHQFKNQFNNQFQPNHVQMEMARNVEEMEIVIELRVVAVAGRVGKELIVVPKNKNKYQFKNQFNNQCKNQYNNQLQTNHVHKEMAKNVEEMAIVIALRVTAIAERVGLVPTVANLVQMQ